MTRMGRGEQLEEKREQDLAAIGGPNVYHIANLCWYILYRRHMKIRLHAKKKLGQYISALRNNLSEA